MPWKDTSAMEEKVAFINEWLSNRYTVTELCEAYGISRTTAYKHFRRYAREGLKTFLEQSRAPAHHPNQTPQDIELAIIDLRKRHKRWGARKIHRLLKNDFPLEREFFRVFMQYGIPKQIHTDNGAPFGSVHAIQRFTKLSYWFIDLGIEPLFSDPGKPQQNGRHERMHRNLKAECAKPAAYDLRTQQRKLNSFVKEYNQIRPHEANNLETPASAH